MIEFVKPIYWENDTLYVLNQLKLPTISEYLPKKNIEEIFWAIKNMELRGAPLIGVSAGYGMYIAIMNTSFSKLEELKSAISKAGNYLAQSRPTAVNLFWAIDRFNDLVNTLTQDDMQNYKKILFTEAVKIHKEDEEINYNIGTHFMPFIKKNIGIMTHCNAGTLATTKYGTATSPMYLAKEQNIPIRVYSNETRPYLQGARLTSYELHKAKIDVTLVCDNMAGMLMSQGKIDMIITGADRVAANGDSANKIGTMQLAILAKYFNIPFYIAAPTPTIDLKTPTGKEIPIEQRSTDEISNWAGRQIAPTGVKMYNPAFDVTPHELITGIVTENGIIKPPYSENILKNLGKL